MTAQRVRAMATCLVAAVLLAGCLDKSDGTSPVDRPRVVVDRASIVNFLDTSDEGGQGNLSIRSKDDIEMLMRDIDAVVDPLMVGDAPPYGLSQSVPMPDGAALWLDYVDDRETFLADVDHIAARLERLGHHATIVARDDVYGPSGSLKRPLKGAVAGLSLIGRPATTKDLPGPRAWVTDPGVMPRVSGLLLNWCTEATHRLYLSADVASSIVSSHQMRTLMPLAIAKSRTKITCVDEGDVVREVEFDPRGHVTVGYGGQDVEDATAVVDSLRQVVIDLSNDVDYAFVRTGDVQSPYWEDPATGLSGARAVQNDATLRIVGRADEDRRVNHAYGIQILGPHHRLTPPASRWRVTDLGSDRRLVETRSPKRWFSHDLPVGLTAAADRDFAPLLGAVG